MIDAFPLMHQTYIVFESIDHQLLIDSWTGKVITEWGTRSSWGWFVWCSSKEHRSRHPWIDIINHWSLDWKVIQSEELIVGVMWMERLNSLGIGMVSNWSMHWKVIIKRVVVFESITDRWTRRWIASLMRSWLWGWCRSWCNRSI